MTERLYDVDIMIKTKTIRVRVDDKLRQHHSNRSDGAQFCRKGITIEWPRYIIDGDDDYDIVDIREVKAETEAMK